MPAPLVIGVGSPFGADRLGWLAVERLAAHRPGGLRTLLLDRPGPNLLHHLDGEARVYLVDAARGPRPIGHLYRLTPAGLGELPVRLTSSHALGVAATLALGTQLGILPRHLEILAVEVAGDDDPHPALARAWPALCAALEIPPQPNDEAPGDHLTRGLD